jgi:CubicO group peptidase (beta-lactamase class C family)
MPPIVDQLASAMSRFARASALSGVIRVQLHGAPVFEEAYGFAQRAAQIPNRCDTRFATASGCKIFTAAAVLQLAEAGKFDLATPLREVLDCGVELDPAITIRHLLTHTSGLYDYLDEELLSEEDYTAIYAENPVYTLLRPAAYPLELDNPAKFPPGQRFHYNNGAFVALAWLVEQQSGEPFQDYVEARIFAPAEMRDSGYFRMDALPANTAYGYVHQAAGGWRTNIFSVPARGNGDGGAFTTAADWSRFWDALRAGRLLGAETVGEMLRPQVAVSPEHPGLHYGYGAWIRAAGDRILQRYVVGSDLGVSMLSATYPEHEVELTILENQGRSLRPIRDALNEVLGEAS